MYSKRRKRKQENVGQQEKSHFLLECKMSSCIREDSKVDFSSKSRQQAGFTVLHHLFHQLAVFIIFIFFFFLFFFFFPKWSKHIGEIILVCVKDFY